MAIKVTAKNIQKVQKELANIEKRANDLSSLMADIAEYLFTITDESFEKEAAPDGTPWADLKPATWRRKKVKKKLYESGNMRNSLHANSSKNKAYVALNATSPKGYLYPAVHQFGSKKTPARPFLPIDKDGNVYEEVIEEIVELIEGYVEGFI